MAQFTKIELEQQIEELQAELKTKEQEKKHLADAIDAKDREVSKKQNEIESIVKKKNEVEEENKKLKTELSEIKYEVEMQNTRIKDLEKIEERRVNELNELIFIHGSFIKTLQGSLETASLLQDKVLEKVTK